MEPRFVTREMILAAERFQTAAENAGMAHARVRWDSPEWSSDGRAELSVFCVSPKMNTGTWKGGAR